MPIEIGMKRKMTQSVKCVEKQRQRQKQIEKEKVKRGKYVDTKMLKIKTYIDGKTRQSFESIEPDT